MEYGAIKRRGEGRQSNVVSKPPPKPLDLKHPAGIYADMTVDGPLIGTLVVVIDKAVCFPRSILTFLVNDERAYMEV